MRLQAGDRLVSMATAPPDSYLLVVSQGGYGKSTLLSKYPQQSRGGQGVRTFRVTPKTGPVAAARVVPDTEGQEIFIISAKAQVMRMTLEDVRVTGRNTLGVIIWRDREPDDYVASIACFQETNHIQAEPNGEGPTPERRRARVPRNGRHTANNSALEP